MLPADTSLGPVQLRVSDRARTADWYERVVGVLPLVSNEEMGTLGTRGAQTILMLREVPGARPMPKRGRVGLYHHALLLPSRAQLGAFLEHLKRIGEPYGASDHWFSEAIYLTDPDGLTLEIYADQPRDTWVWRDGQVEGGIDPLDEHALLDAIEEPWSGLPKGTIMGHVHFFTGDLAAAHRFYVEGLGFEIATQRFPGALFVSAGHYHHHVGLNVWAADQPVAGPEDVGIDFWVLRVRAAAERAAARARLEALGVPVVERGDGFEATDPWGIRVVVTQ